MSKQSQLNSFQLTVKGKGYNRRMYFAHCRPIVGPNLSHLLRLHHVILINSSSATLINTEVYSSFRRFLKKDQIKKVTADYTYYSFRHIFFLCSLFLTFNNTAIKY